VVTPTEADLIADTKASCGAEVTPTGRWDDQYQVTTAELIFYLDFTVGYDDEGIPDDPIPYGYFPWHFGVREPRFPEPAAKVVAIMRGLLDALAATGRYECVLFRISSEEILAAHLDQLQPPPGEET
jgi:hypothetical protein